MCVCVWCVVWTFIRHVFETCEYCDPVKCNCKVLQWSPFSPTPPPFSSEGHADSLYHPAVGGPVAKLKCRSIWKCKIQHCQAYWCKIGPFNKKHITLVALCTMSSNLVSSLHWKSCWSRETAAAVNSPSFKTQQRKHQTRHIFSKLWIEMKTACHGCNVHYNVNMIYI